MDIASIGGIEIAYRTAGSESGEPIVLIHGYTGNLRNWALTVPALVEAGWRTLSPDNPGHGGSAAPREFDAYALDRVAELIHQLAEGLDFKPAVIAGHSMGGAIAEEYAARFPEAVRGLVLLDSAGAASGPEREDLSGDMEQLRAVYQERGMTAVFDEQRRLGKRPQLDTLSPEAIEQLRMEFARTSFEGFEFGALALRTRHETLTRLEGLAVPALVVRGEHESPQLTKVAEDLAAAIPHARAEVIPGAGHVPQIEAPQAFNRVLLEFLQALP